MKVILNGCWGGYFWSQRALDMIEARRGWLPRNMEELRTDPVAVKVLEEFGSSWCSAPSSHLTIEEYDETMFRHELRDYDGCEELVLFPRLTREQVLSSGSLEKVVELLEKCGVIGQPVTHAFALESDDSEDAVGKATVVAAGLNPEGDEYARPVYSV